MEHVYRLATTSAPVPAATAALLRRAGFTPADELRAAPVLTVNDTATGEQVTLEGCRGQLVVLQFWGTTCTHCLKEFPPLERLARSYDGRGLTVLCVCADEADAVAAERLGRPHAGGLRLCVDPRSLAPARYEVQALPCSILIDPAGRLLGRAQGARDWSGPEVGDLFSACLPAGR